MARKTLQDLENIIKSVDPDGKMQGVSYERTSNNTLGFGNSPPTYHVAIPHPTWPSGDKSTWATPKGSSILQEAFKDVLSAGAASVSKDGAEPSGIFLIDISHLQGGFGGWFTERPNAGENVNQSVAEKIIQIVEGLKPYPKVKPVIRFLQGLWGSNLDSVGQTAWEALGIKDDIKAAFWKADGSPLITNANAEIYLGLYGPDFNSKADERDKEAHDFEKSAEEAAGWLKELAGQWEGSLQAVGAGNALKDVVQKWDAKAIVDSLLSKNLRSASWNHGKILAVNGTHMMTGGANYWGDYGIGAGDVYDMSAKIQGGATQSAHRYLDYFWDYLQGELGTDGRSHLRMGKLDKNFPEAWTVRHDKITVTVPMFMTSKTTSDPPKPTSVQAAAAKNQGNTPVLTVAKLGDWYGEMTHIRYPVQMVDALRDVAVNALWHLTHQVATETDVIDTLKRAAVMKSLSNFVESVKDTKLRDTLGKMKIHPAAWASRLVRVGAIASAQKCVRMSVEHLVYCDLVGQKKWQEVMASVDGMTAGILKVEDAKSLDLKHKWNGWLWPYDLLYAWADCIYRGIKVQVIVTTSNPSSGYKDPVPDLDLQKARVAEVLAAYSPGWVGTLGFLFGTAEDKVKECFEIVRIRDNDGKFNHAKVVCVDDELLYIGSDNAYTSFNEEHGVWIDDETAISAWKRDYWERLWTESQPKKA